MKIGRLLRHELQDAPRRVIGQQIQSALGALTHIAYPLALRFEIGQQTLFAHDFLSVQRQPDEILGLMATDEEVAVPLGKQATGVERHAARPNDRIPVVERLLHAVLRRDAASNFPAEVLDAVRDRRPAIVLARARNVDLVAAARAVLDFPQLTGGRVQRRGLDVAMAKRPDLGPDALLSHERVVPRNRSVRIQSHDFSEQPVHSLCLHPAFGDRPLALRNEQRTVASEHEPAAEVRRRHHRRHLVVDDLRVLDSRIGGLDEPAAGDRCVVRAAGARLRVAPVDQSVRREGWIECDVEQSALTARIDRRKTRNRRRERSAGCNDSQAAGPLRDEHALARQECETPGVLQSTGDRDDVEQHGALLFRRASLAGKRRRLAGRVRP